MKEKENLFKEFQQVSHQEWVDKIKADLKGADYDRKMISKTLDGITRQPFYQKDALQNLKHLQAQPGHAPFTRGIQQFENHWEVRQDILAHDLKQAQQQLTDALINGVDVIGLCAQLHQGKVKGLPLLDFDNFKDLFSGHEKLPKVALDGGLLTPYWYILYKELAIKKGVTPAHLTGCLDYDPIGLTFQGYASQEDLPLLLDEVNEMAAQTDPNSTFRLVTIDGSLFNTCAATPVQELALTLALASEYVAQLSQRHLTMGQILARLQFKMAVGSQYFQEIAKCRALRYLFCQVITAYDEEAFEKAYIPLTATTSRFNMTLFDPHVNMLRATSEVMSAALGGAETISVLPYDITATEPGDFSLRIARNTQHVLKHESYLDKVCDPAAGSYFIETLTDTMAREAWSLFQKIESSGGLLEYYKKGLLAEDLGQSLQSRRQNLAHRKEILLGSNQYPNPQENKLTQLSEDACTTVQPQEAKARIDFNGLHSGLSVEEFLSRFQESPKSSCHITPTRAALDFEVLRLQTEQHVASGGELPQVSLFPFGNRAMRTARSIFSLNFFATAGYAIHQNPGFDTLEEGLEIVLKQQPNIIVFCSADEDYNEALVPIIKNILQKNPNVQLVIAGYPQDKLETLKSYGIHHFIHARANVYGMLVQFQKDLGIKG